MQNQLWMLLAVALLLAESQFACAQEVIAPPVFAPPTALPAVMTDEPSQSTPALHPLADVVVETHSTPQTDLLNLTSTAETMWYQPTYWFGPAPWDIGLELGLNGSEGINQSLSMRAGGHLKRKTDFWKFDTSLAYNKNSANGIETQNNALLDVRVDRLLGESPWTLFFLNQDLYDEFQAFDLRVSLNTGIGYQLLDTENKNLISRFGAGTSREFGGPDDSWAQEALFGLDYEHKLTSTQRLTAKVDYFPEWEDFSRYRVVTDIGWEIDLDQPRNMSLKFSINDRYDSTPNGAEPNELNYAVLLIWGLK